MLGLMVGGMPGPCRKQHRVQSRKEKAAKNRNGNHGLPDPPFYRLVTVQLHLFSSPQQLYFSLSLTIETTQQQQNNCKTTIQNTMFSLPFLVQTERSYKKTAIKVRLVQDLQRRKEREEMK